jgi:hypothetical protein
MGVTGRKLAKMKKIAILQSNYIPWKGYFDIINMVDEFVIYDDVQYTRRDWRNRNCIKTQNGLKWLSIPVKVKGKYNQKIRETRIADNNWASQHWKILKQNYKTASCFGIYTDLFEKTYYQASKMEFLSEVNRLFINTVNSILGIETLITDTPNDLIEGNKTEKIIAICNRADADIYLTGPSAKQYIDTKLFSDSHISLEWIDYNGYPAYPQQCSPFVHTVSIIDVIFNCGKNSPSVMKSF